MDRCKDRKYYERRRHTSQKLVETWEEENKPKTIITTTPSEVKGLDNMSISLDESIRSIDDAEDINYDDMAGG
ncbi:MAG: hypothetical protein CM15mV7_1540 [uncultured marine virus]|nr:MAG: hypothetical protein CM15mV7_1540 [uncultured marine virus]